MNTDESLAADIRRTQLAMDQRHSRRIEFAPDSFRAPKDLKKREHWGWLVFVGAIVTAIVWVFIAEF